MADRTDRRVLRTLVPCPPQLVPPCVPAACRRVHEEIEAGRGAIELLVDEDRERLVVNPAMCQGCGACAAVCPNDASVLEGFPAQQMLAMIDAAI